MSSARDRAAGYEAGEQQGAGAPAGSPGAHRETAGYAGDDARQQAGARAGYGRGDDYGRSGGMAQSGFTALAATLMILAGLWSFLEGLIGIVHQSFYRTMPSYYYGFTIHDWGWVHLALGIVLFAAGACVLLGQTWAKVVGITLAVFSGIANFMFLPYYPLWSIIMIAIDLFIIWALATGIGRRATA
jgi:hypothetical protein